MWHRPAATHREWPCNDFAASRPSRIVRDLPISRPQPPISGLSSFTSAVAPTRLCQRQSTPVASPAIDRFS